MAIIVKTPEPEALLAAVKKAIKDGKVETWSYDSDGDFTHSPEQWLKKAWLRPTVTDGKITFRIFPPKDTTLSSVVYAIYHGRFIEMLVRHFDESFSDATATALPQHGDLVR